MSLYYEMAADIAQVVADFGKPIKIHGVDHTALISEPALDLGLKVGGLDFRARLTAKLSHTALTRIPQTGDEFLYNAVRYHVQTEVDRPPHECATTGP